MGASPGQLYRFTTIRWAINHYSFCPLLLKLFVSVRDGGIVTLVIFVSCSSTRISSLSLCLLSPPPRLISLHLCCSHVCFSPQNASSEVFLSLSTITLRGSPVTIWSPTHFDMVKTQQGKWEWKYSKEAANWHVLLFLVHLYLLSRLVAAEGSEPRFMKEEEEEEEESSEEEEEELTPEEQGKHGDYFFQLITSTPSSALIYQVSVEYYHDDMRISCCRFNIKQRSHNSNERGVYQYPR